MHKLVEVVLTSVELGRCFSTLKGAKTCLRNPTGQEQVNAVAVLSVLSIHKEAIADTSRFNQKAIIKFFASQKSRRENFLNKVILKGIYYIT